MSRKIDARELLAALGGLLVLISLFLDWYERAGISITGWRAFEALDLVLAALAIAAIATGAAVLGAVAALPSRALLPLGGALVLVVAIQLISPPPVAWDADLATGAWMALAGSLLVLLGGALTAASIDITVNVGARDTRRRTAAVDRRPSATPPADEPPKSFSTGPFRAPSADDAAAGAARPSGRGSDAASAASGGAARPSGRGGDAASAASGGAARPSGRGGAGREADEGDEVRPRRSLLDEPDPDATQPFKPVDDPDS